MDDKWIDILSSLPPKPPRSRLEPYAGLIEEMRRRGRTYREISRVLAERCQVRVSRSNVHHFVSLRRRKAEGEAPVEETHDVSRPVPTQPGNELRQRIDALKQRRMAENPRPGEFDFDPSEPLRLQKPDGKNSGP